MLTIILIILLVVLFVFCVGVVVLNKRLQKEIEDLKDEGDRNFQDYLGKAIMHQLRASEDVEKLLNITDTLEEERDNAYKCLELALNASPSQFNDVDVELGIHGVIYQFHSLDKEVEAT